MTPKFSESQRAAAYQLLHKEAQVAVAKNGLCFLGSVTDLFLDNFSWLAGVEDAIRLKEEMLDTPYFILEGGSL